MTIREIEERLGIPRATVRYYEREGLLSPARGGNNYRDYTQEDLNTLEKICLLRQLDMPLDTIRAVQRGEVPLREALERQEKLLEDGAERRRRATELCRSLLRDNVTYPALDVERYREAPALPDAAASGGGDSPAAPTTPTLAKPWLREPPPLPEGAVKAFNPWQRFWARTLDMAIADLVVMAVLALIFRVSPITNDSNLLDVGFLVLEWLVVFLAEPLLLSTWGNTPGKWLLGLKLEDYFGRKLTWWAGFSRCCGVLTEGFGLHIPIYSLWRHWKCYKACRDEQPLDYDSENRYYSRVGDRWRWRAVGAVLVTLVLVAAAVAVSFQAILPPHRGNLTREAFYDNVSALSDNGYWSDRSLTGGGMWIDDKGYLLYDRQGYTTTDSQGREIGYGDRMEDTPLYTLETDGSGVVTAVHLAWESDWAAGADVLPIKRAILATAAFQGSTVGALELAQSPILQVLQKLGELPDGEPVTVKSGEFTATLTLSGENYRSGLYGLVYAGEDGQPSSCHFTFRLEKTDNSWGRGKDPSSFSSAGDPPPDPVLSNRMPAGKIHSCRRLSARLPACFQHLFIINYLMFIIK